MATTRGRHPPCAGACARLALLLGAAGSLLPLPGCDGEGGVAGHTPFAGARVCLDGNSSLTCDGGEPAVDSDPAGAFSIGGGAPRSSSVLVVEIEPGDTSLLEDRPSATALRLVASDLRRAEVTVWSTMAWARVRSGAAATADDAREQVRTAFGLPFDFDEPGGSSVAASATRERSLAQLTLGDYVQRYGAAPTGSEDERIRQAAEATFAAAGQLQALLDWYLGAQQAPPPANAGPGPTRTFWADFDRIPLSVDMAYGTGLDESTFGLKGNCLVASPPPQPGLCENSSEYVFELVNTVDDVAKHFEIGATAKAGVSVAGFDVVSVSGGFQFLKDSVMDDEHLYIAIRHAEVLCGYPVAAELDPVWADRYATDYASFRSSCGDRYLTSITTGGYFYGLIEVSLSVDQKIEEERLKLSGKVLGIKVFDKTWTSTAAEIARDYTTRTRVVSNFFTYDHNTLDMAGVIQEYGEFRNRIEGAACHGPTASTDCGYLASFATYATATTRAAAPSPVSSTWLPNMRSYERFYFDAEDILADLADIIAHPEGYSIGTAVDVLHEPNDWSLDRLVAVRAALLQRRDQALASWSDCSADISRCTASAADLHFSDDPLLPSWLDAKLALPEKKFSPPADCPELATLFGLLADDTYDLYFGGRLDETYRADCAYLATTDPVTYLVLENTSASAAQPSYNHVWSATGPGAGAGKTFSRLLVVAGSDAVTGAPFLEVTGPQPDFIEVSTADAGVVDLLKRAPVLSARARGGGSATANLNLDGTGLHVGPDPVLELRGNVLGYRYAVTVSGDRRSVDLLLEPVPGSAAGSTDEAVVVPAIPIRLVHD